MTSDIVARAFTQLRLLADMHTEDRRMIADLQRRLKKAEHDRDRYRCRIRFMDGRHAHLREAYHGERAFRTALEKQIDVLEKHIQHKEEDHGA